MTSRPYNPARPAAAPADGRRWAAGRRGLVARRVVAMLGAAGALAAAAPAPVEAGSSTRVVCSWRVPLYETPGGLVVGSATRGDRVVVLRRGRTPWVRVRTDWGTRGWLRRGHLC